MTGPQIYQINHEDNSFQNMYGMLSATIDRLARNTDFVQKKHLPWKLWGTTVQIIYMGILVQAIVWNYSMSESSIRSTKLSVTYYCCWGNTVSWIASSSPPICLLSSIGTIDIGTLDQQRKQSNLNINWTSEECILFLSPIRIALPIIFNIFVVVSAQPSFSLCCKRFRWERMRRVLSLETGVV